MKEYAKANFHSGKALNSPPHITLIPPFRLNQSKQQSLIAVLDEFARSWPPIDLELNGFGHFSNRVIYVAVKEQRLLLMLQIKLVEMLEAQIGIGGSETYRFHPHLTIAFRDLTPDAFHAAWQHFQGVDYQRKFVASPPVLLRHTGLKWEVVHPGLPLDESMEQ